MKIYVASSWRNGRQPEVVRALQAEGHDVYDFRNPSPGDQGFSWDQIDQDWWSWSPGEFVRGLGHKIALAGYAKDQAALEDCDLCILVNPCGRSAHLEAGFALGRGKWLCILLADGDEPELMYLGAAHFALTVADVVRFAANIQMWIKQTGQIPDPISPADPLRLALLARDLSKESLESAQSAANPVSVPLCLCGESSGGQL